MNENKIKELIAAVGSLAELSSLFFKSLLETGIDQYDAIVLTGEFINSLIKKDD